MEQLKPCVLVADDSRVVRKAANSILKGEYRVLEAGNGTEALSLLDVTPDICAVFLDLWMPDIDGFEVLKKMRDSQNPRLADMPVIVITGHSENAGIRDRALSLGASDFVGKPFTGAQLLGSVRQILGADDDREEVLLPSFAANDDSMDKQEEAESKEHSPEGKSGETKELKNVVPIKPKPGRQNRREYLLQCGSSLLSRALRDRRGLAVLKIRVERVGALYHKCGEAFARDTLGQLARTISNETRRKDLLMRLNVTDFAVVMPATSGLEARDVSKSIIRAVRRHIISFEGHKFHLTMSGGLVTPKLSSSTQFETLLALADARLEKAAESGGGQLVLDEMPLSESDPRVSIDDAVVGLNQGDTSIASGHLVTILKRVFPFLVFADTRLKLDMGDALKALHERVKAL